MSDANATPEGSPEPPLVLRVESAAAAPAPAAAPKRLRPGFGEAILWCFLFLAAPIGGALLGMFGILGVYALGAEKPGDFLLDQLTGLGKATAATAPPDGRPPVVAERDAAFQFELPCLKRLGEQVFLGLRQVQSHGDLIEAGHAPELARQYSLDGDCAAGAGPGAAPCSEGLHYRHR